MSQISFKYNFEVFACSTFLHTPPPEFTWIAVHFIEVLRLKALLPLPLNSRALQCILVNCLIQPNPTSTPEFTCIAIHFGAELFSIKVTCCKFKMFAPYSTGGGKYREVIFSSMCPPNRTCIMVVFPLLAWTLQIGNPCACRLSWLQLQYQRCDFRPM